jgi:hypothetical protein
VWGVVEAITRWIGPVRPTCAATRPGPVGHNALEAHTIIGQAQAHSSTVQPPAGSRDDRRRCSPESGMTPRPLLSRLRLAPLLHDGHHLRRLLSAAAAPPPLLDESPPGAPPPPSNSRLFVAGTTLLSRIRVCLPSDPRLQHGSRLITSRFPACAHRFVVVRGRALPHGRLLLLRHRHRRYETESQTGTSLLLHLGS